MLHPLPAMRFVPPLLTLLTLAACHPVAPPPALQLPVNDSLPRVAAVPASQPAPVPRPPPAIATFAPRVVQRTISGIEFEGVEFDARRQRLRVVDQAAGPSSQFADAASAARAHAGHAAVNAGFFTPQGEPLGMVIQQGKKSGAWNSTSSLGSGIWSDDPAAGPSIRRRETIAPAVAKTQRELLQAGPMLISYGRAVSGLDPTKSSVRTLILWDGSSRWWIGRSSPCSLAALSQALASRSPTGWPIVQALNLDGGRSADLWVSASVAGSPLTRRAPWNRPVRNFLVLVDR
jgi:hypothetical protein